MYPSSSTQQKRGILVVTHHVSTLRILTPQEWLFWGPPNTPAIQVHSPFHWRVQGFLDEGRWLKKTNMFLTNHKLPLCLLTEISITTSFGSFWGSIHTKPQSLDHFLVPDWGYLIPMTDPWSFGIFTDPWNGWFLYIFMVNIGIITYIYDILPTLTIKINHSCRDKYTVRPMDPMGFNFNLPSLFSEEKKLIPTGLTLGFVVAVVFVVVVVL